MKPVNLVSYFILFVSISLEIYPISSFAFESLYSHDENKTYSSDFKYFETAFHRGSKNKKSRVKTQSVMTQNGRLAPKSITHHGLPSQHTHVSFDGISANDPSTPTGSYDFTRSIGLLSQENLSRSKDFQYYTTMPQFGEKILQSDLGIGNLKTRLMKIQYSEGKNSHRFNSSLSIEDQDGIDQSQNGDGEKDGLSAYSFRGRYEVLLPQNFAISISSHNNHSVTEGDEEKWNENTARMEYFDNDQIKLKQSQFLNGIDLRYLPSNNFSHSLHFNQTFHKREYISDRYAAQTYEGQYQLNSSFFKQTFILKKTEFDRKSLYTEDEFDQNEQRIQNEFTFQLDKTEININYSPFNITNQKIEHNFKSSVEKFISNFESVELSFTRESLAPTLFQRFDSLYGNQDLQNEILESIEASYSIHSRQINFEVSPFYNVIKHQFGYDPVSYKSKNLGQYSIIGFDSKVEVDLSLVTLSQSYTRLNNIESKQNLAKHHSDTELSLYPNDNWEWTFNYRYLSERQIFSQQTSEKKTIHVQGKYNADKNYSTSLMVDNLFNSKREDMPGVRPMPLTFILALIWKT